MRFFVGPFSTSQDTFCLYDSYLCCWIGLPFRGIRNFRSFTDVAIKYSAWTGHVVLVCVKRNNEFMAVISHGNV